MTEILHLRRMRVRYRVDRDDPGLRRQLDAVLDRVLGEALEPALARSGVPRGEEICVRSLRVPVHVSLGAGEASAAAAWSAALADAIAAVLAGGPGPDVVRFRSRRAALADLALGVAAGRLERIWAWRQLGLWRGGDTPGDRAAAFELVTALAGEPESIVPVLAEVAVAGTLPRLVERIEPAVWVELARSAVTAAGASADGLEAAASLSPVPAPGAPALAAADGAPSDGAEPASAAEVTEHALRVLRASAIGRVATSLLAHVATGRRELAAALAVLAWLETEPDVARGLPAADEVVAALTEALSRPSFRAEPAVPGGPDADRAPPSERAAERAAGDPAAVDAD
jgi:hypothetical protein